MLKHSVKEVVLKSGARGLLIDVPDASVVCAQISFRAGDQYVKDPKKLETAHIMEHMSLGANKKFPSSKKFTAEIQKNGAYTNASTAPVDMTYTMECADFEWERVLELLCLGISQPLFLDEEFKAEYGNVREEMLYRGNNHDWHLSLEMEKRFGVDIETFQERLKLMPNVTVEDIRQHYQETHFSQNMRFIIAGRMKGRIRKISKLLNDMSLPKNKAGMRFEIPKTTLKMPDEPIFIENSTVPNAYFYIISYLAEKISRDEALAMGTLGAILTDTWGSRIFGTAREKGLVYYLNSGIDREEDYAAWWFGSQVSEKQLNQLLKLIISEINRVKNGVLSQKDLESAKMYMIGSHQRSAQTVGAIVNGYSGRYFREDLINDYFTHFPNRVEKITKNDVIAIARKMLQDKIWGVGFLGTISKEARTKAHMQVSALWPN
ncbi:insulinase family protein [Candidatus Saccharibacteria bacterium]|nr:insulinase family protein [Candidatus Saccharibacteria bacterium]